MPFPTLDQAPVTTSHRRHGDDPLAFLRRLAVTKQDVVPFLIGRRQAFLLTSAAGIETVLVRSAHAFDKGPGYLAASRLLGSGLLTADAAAHAERRRAVTPAFHRASLQSAVPAIVRHAAGCRERWHTGGRIDLAEEMRALTLAIASEALFGADSSPWSAVVSRALAQAVAPADGLVAIVAPPRSVRRARRDLDIAIDAILEARRARASRQSGDLLSLLMDSGASEEQIRDDARTFLVAGHDTMSHALTWTWLLLAAYPAADDALGREVEMVLGSRLPEADDVPQLTYTRAVVREALRLWPPAWIIVRRAQRAIRIGGVDIPPRALVVASPFVTHRDERYFERPDDFIPERWLPPASDADRPKYTYFPFGAGTRACVGEHFAWLEATLVLATLAQQWRAPRIALDAVQPVARVTLRPGPLPPVTPARRLPAPA
jgi:cytochrome P450